MTTTGFKEEDMVGIFFFHFYVLSTDNAQVSI